MYHHYNYNYVELSVFSFYFQFTREKIRMISSIYDGDMFAKKWKFQYRPKLHIWFGHVQKFPPCSMIENSFKKKKKTCYVFWFPPLITSCSKFPTTKIKNYWIKHTNIDYHDVKERISHFSVCGKQYYRCPSKNVTYTT